MICRTGTFDAPGADALQGADPLEQAYAVEDDDTADRAPP